MVIFPVNIYIGFLLTFYNWMQVYLKKFVCSTWKVLPYEDCLIEAKHPYCQPQVILYYYHLYNFQLNGNIKMGPQAHNFTRKSYIHTEMFPVSTRIQELCMQVPETMTTLNRSHSFKTFRWDHTCIIIHTAYLSLVISLEWLIKMW